MTPGGRGTSRAVPLGRRLLAARRLRLAAGATGIGLALMMLLLLDGLWTGVQGRVTAYEDHTGAQLAVLAAGTESLFADASTLPADAVASVAAVPGVRAASGVHTMYTILELHNGKAAAALVGSVPGRLGGPWDMATGRPPRDGEVAVDVLFAEEHGLQPGDALPVLGDALRIVGLTRGTDMFMTPLVFTTDATLSGLLQLPGTTGAVLVSTDDPAGVSSRLQEAGFTVRTMDELRQASLRLTTRIFGGPVRLMIGISFAAGTLIIALVSYTLVAEQRRDLGVLKALGATPQRLRRLAVVQTMTVTALGAATSAVLIVAARALIGVWKPSFPVALPTGSLGRAAVAAIAMALLAAWLPARQVARVDAASAFRSGS